MPEIAEQPDQGKGLGNPHKATPNAVNVKVDRGSFPYPHETGRLAAYDFSEKLFWGNHFDAFNVKIESKEYGQQYARLKFIVANFPKLITLIAADMLFIEPPKFQMGDDGDQEFVDALIEDNDFRLQMYESAIDNSYFGDILFKLRVGPRRAGQKSTIIIDKQTPKVYFPKYNPFNMTGEPESQELSWVVKSGEKTYLRKELHEIGIIRNQLFEMDGSKLGAEVPISSIIPSVKEEEKTKIEESTLIHIRNFRAGNRWNGVSDYFDLDTLFYAIDNRLTKVDNVLDTHSDPILALPQGILDEEGKIKRGKLKMFERPEGADQSEDPAYATWDANLESAFKEIEKMIDLTFMMSETSPHVLGLGDGAIESGFALKLKLLRTLAKIQRKQLYYKQSLIEIIYRAQLLASEFGIEVRGKKLAKDPKRPEIVWRDGLPADLSSLLDEETKRIDAGITTKVDSIMRVDDLDKKAAEKKLEEIKQEQKEMMPINPMNVSGDANKFSKNPNQPNQPADPNKDPKTQPNQPGK